MRGCTLKFQKINAISQVILELKKIFQLNLPSLSTIYELFLTVINSYFPKELTEISDTQHSEKETANPK